MTATMSAMDRDHVPFVEIAELRVAFGHGRNRMQALNGVSLRIAQGRSMGLVGESGSGKSTLAKALVGLNRIESGRMVIAGVDATELRRLTRQQRRTLVQMIPQDPYLSLSPRRTAGQAIAEALDPVHADVRRHRDEIVRWLEAVDLSADSIGKYPHQFSGGQRQRIAIARALCVQPRFVVADEITSALDLSIQAEVLALLADLRERLELTMLFISHNLAVVRHVCDDVTVLYHGDVVEEGPVERVFDRPESSYTRALVASIPGSPGFSVRG